MSDFRSLTLLNSTGDVTLSWNEDQDSAMREMIEEKIKEGYAFFIIEPRSSFIKLLGNKRDQPRPTFHLGEASCQSTSLAIFFTSLLTLLLLVVSNYR